MPRNTFTKPNLTNRIHIRIFVAYVTYLMLVSLPLLFDMHRLALKVAQRKVVSISAKMEFTVRMTVESFRDLHHLK